MWSQRTKPIVLAFLTLGTTWLGSGMGAGFSGRGSAAVAMGLDSLQVIGQFDHVGLAVFGDTDHDGVNEIISDTWTVPSLQGFLRILEYVHYGQFVPVFEGTFMHPLAVGDADQDGKSDLVGLGNGSRLQIYESMDQNSHPSNLVWESPSISNQVGFAAIADTDADGRLEIVYLFYAGTIRIIIFECVGDDTYVQKYLSPLDSGARNNASLENMYNPWAGDELVWDLDRDGRPEIADGGQGKLQIYESTADDVWERIYVDSTGLVSSRILTGGQDSDGNGRRELFLGGEDWSIEPLVRKVFVYEPDGDRAFTRVATLTAFDNASGGQWGALTRTEYDGRIRFVWALYQHLRLYVTAGPGVWQLETIIQDPDAPYHHAVHAYDLNRNGRDEIYWLTSANNMPSLVLERPTLPTDVSGNTALPWVGTLRVTPSPCRGDAAVFLDPALAPRAALWSVFDASGRLVLQERLGPSAGPWVLPAKTLSSGLYFLRVTDALGQRVATGRAVVVR